MRKTALTLLFVVIMAVGSGCGQSAEADRSGEQREASLVEISERAGVEWFMPPEQIDGVNQKLVGRGPDAAMILWPQGAPPPRRTIIYLHPWMSLPPSAMVDDVKAYLALGSTVIYPVYQGKDTDPTTVRGHAIRGIKAAMSTHDRTPTDVAVVGLTTGGALAFDFAALASDKGLPRPRALVAIHPTRDPERPIPAADLSRIHPATRILVVTSTDPPIAEGRKLARLFLRDAERVPDERKNLFIEQLKNVDPRSYGYAGPPIRRLSVAFLTEEFDDDE